MRRLLLLYFAACALPPAALACQPSIFYDSDFGFPSHAQLLASWAASFEPARGRVVPTGKRRVETTWYEDGWYTERTVFWDAEFIGHKLGPSGEEIPYTAPVSVSYACGWTCFFIRPYVLENRGLLHEPLPPWEQTTFTIGNNGMCEHYQVESDLPFSDNAWEFMRTCRGGECPHEDTTNLYAYDYKQEDPFPYGLH